jgi:hypothetical protein
MDRALQPMPDLFLIKTEQFRKQDIGRLKRIDVRRRGDGREWYVRQRRFPCIIKPPIVAIVGLMKTCMIAEGSSGVGTL